MDGVSGEFFIAAGWEKRLRRAMDRYAHEHDGDTPTYDEMESFFAAHGVMRGASRGSLHRYVAGRYDNPRPEILKLFARLLQVREGWLLFESGEMTQQDEIDKQMELARGDDEGGEPSSLLEAHARREARAEREVAARRKATDQAIGRFYLGDNIAVKGQFWRLCDHWARATDTKSREVVEDVAEFVREVSWRLPGTSFSRDAHERFLIALMHAFELGTTPERPRPGGSSTFIPHKPARFFHPEVEED